MLSIFCRVGGWKIMRRRLKRDNIFIKIFVFHSSKYSILNFSLRNPEFLFLNFPQNSYFHFYKCHGIKFLIPLFMNHFHVTKISSRVIFLSVTNQITFCPISVLSDHFKDQSESSAPSTNKNTALT